MDVRKIVFVPRRSRIRLYKIAKSLRYTGQFRLICVCEEAFYDPALFEGLFDEVHFYKRKNVLSRDSRFRNWNDRLFPNFGKLTKIVKAIKPDLIHAFCEPYDHIEHLIKMVDVPIVMTDGADFSGISFGLPTLGAKVIEQEKFCMENVQGLIYKGPGAVTDYYRSHGFDIKCVELSWFDHCDEDLFVDPGIKKLSEQDGELHFVYTGNVSDNPQKKYIYYVDLIKQLAEQKIHLHVYPNPYQFQAFDVYKKMAESIPYFHWHEPLPMKELIQEIGQYDWGFWIHADQVSFRTSRDKINVGIGNKLFTYLEAGLPVLVSDSRLFGVKVIEENGVGMKVSDDDWGRFGEIIGQIDYAELRASVLDARNSLSLRSNGTQIAEFYMKILN